MKTCLICQGQKFVYGMGNMREKCKNCDGKGFIKDKIEEPISMTTKKSKEKENVREG